LAVASIFKLGFNITRERGALADSAEIDELAMNRAFRRRLLAALGIVGT